MPRSRGEPFTTIRSEGSLLPPDLLQRIAEGDRKVPGLTPEANHLAGNEKDGTGQHEGRYRTACRGYSGTRR